MAFDNIAENELCYLDGAPTVGARKRRRVERAHGFEWSWLRGSMTQVSTPHAGLSGRERAAIASGRPDGIEGRWLAWGRPAFALAVVLVLIMLGVANVAMRARWHEVEDGVLWSARAEGVVATEVAAGSAAARAGIERDDVLIAVNGSPVQTPADVIEYEHGGTPGTHLTYTLLRLGTRQALDVSLAAVPQ